jgi:hypothetical protein
MQRNYDPGVIGGAAKHRMAAFLAVELETELAGYPNEISGLDNRESRAHAPTSTGRIRKSSAGTGSP